MYVSLSLPLSLSIHLSINVCVCVCVCVSASTYVYDIEYVYMYVYKHTKIHKHICSWKRYQAWLKPRCTHTHKDTIHAHTHAFAVGSGIGRDWSRGVYTHTKILYMHTHTHICSWKRYRAWLKPRWFPWKARHQAASFPPMTLPQGPGTRYLYQIFKQQQAVNLVGGYSALLYYIPAKKCCRGTLVPDQSTAHR